MELKTIEKGKIFVPPLIVLVSPSLPFCLHMLIQ